jgi:hypothetical protein
MGGKKFLKKSSGSVLKKVSAGKISSGKSGGSGS